MNNIEVRKQDNTLDENKSTDAFLKYFVLIVILLIVIAYIGILPPEIQKVTTEEIPGFSGTFIKVDDQYFASVIAINNIQFIVAAITSVLSFIFIIWRRNIIEVLALLFLGMLPRERKTWGVVRDRSNFAFIPFSQLRFFKVDSDDSRELVSSAVSDLDGRYRIQLKDKSLKYLIEVKASGYKVYSKEISFINTLIDSNLIIDDILLEKEVSEVSFRSRLNEIRPRIYSSLIYFIFITYIASLPLAFFAILNNPILINWLFILTALTTTVWNIKVIRERYYPKISKFLDQAGNPIKNSDVILFDNKSKVTSSTTNSEGIAKFDIEPGSYLIKDSNGQFLPVRINSKGYIQDDVRLSGVFIEKVDNPFS